MTRCPAYYERWKREPNWCEKCPSAVSTINKYLKLHEKLTEGGADPQFSYEKLTENTARDIAKIPDDVITKMIPEIVVLINNPNVNKISSAQLNAIEINRPPKIPNERPETQKRLELDIKRHERKIGDYQEKISVLKEELEELREKLDKFIRPRLETEETVIPKPKKRPKQ